MSDIYIDGDACPVREEVFRVAQRLKLGVYVVTNGSRPIRPPRQHGVHMVTVEQGPDKADDWIAERITAADICVTADVPLAARCLKRNTRVVSPKGREWTEVNIGAALAGREVAQHLREMGAMTGGPAPFSKADRSNFLVALDRLAQAALRDATR